MAHDHQHDGHGHGHHGHDHAPKTFGRAFAIGIALNIIYVAAEAVYGIAAHSLALLADAGHNLGDVLGLVAAWVAASLGQRRPSRTYTYGLRGSSILAALGNAVALLLITGGIAWEAIQRLMTPEPVAGLTVTIVAAVGFVINAATALLFMNGRKSDLNVHGAFLHMAADALVSLGTVGAGLLILWTGWLWIDPAVSLVVSAVIVAGTWGLLRDSFRLAMAAVPPGLDRAEIELYLAGLPGVVSVHDLHIWAMSTTETALTAHIVRQGGRADDALLHEAAEQLRHRFQIGHATLQVETGDPAYPCRLAPDHVV
jgi:cobalt-zinc-cadmium efflux system protein